MNFDIQEVENTLNNIGLSIYKNTDKKEQKSYEDVLEDISKIWSTLNDSQKDNVSCNMTGMHNNIAFESLMQNMKDKNNIGSDK
ncbi:MAG: hypothetical protein LIR50_03855 [Bacillota bacterium]|nr:hypothetical protein [Bacillota bacterium]